LTAHLSPEIIDIVLYHAALQRDTQQNQESL
jgi:hypothetical protein